MWGRKRKTADQPAADAGPLPLKEALRQVRNELAERSSVVVDLRDAELARLELLNEALDPLFADIGREIELFDRGISRGDTPRLWLDAIAHVAMGRDKRRYRLMQDTRYGRKILAESTEIPEMVHAITRYVASRLIERERALAEDVSPPSARLLPDIRIERRRRRWRMFWAFAFGLLLGCASLLAALLFVAAQIQR